LIRKDMIELGKLFHAEVLDDVGLFDELGEGI
jgi:hypothetical protein